MPVLAAIGALVLILGILWDGFETVVLPRRVMRPVGLTRFFQRVSWTPWSAPVKQRLSSPRREDWLSLYAPLSQLFLLVIWAGGLIIGFAVLQWALGSQYDTPDHQPGFGTDLYVSGTTFFTLGLGDVSPRSPLARLVTVIESGTGFGLLALVITYLPVVYQAFSRREARISMLDEWAGSPPTAVDFLSRQAQRGGLPEIRGFFLEWERWASELMETHLTYPVLAYYRSQHENQSWLGGLTMILDVSALVMAGIEGVPPLPAQLAFAIARHSAVDLSQVLGVPPRSDMTDRLPASDVANLWRMLAEGGVPVQHQPGTDAKLSELRQQYEPYVQALSEYLLMPLPPWVPLQRRRDNWQTTMWQTGD